MLYTLTMHPAVDLFFTPALRSDAAVRAGGKGVRTANGKAIAPPGADELYKLYK